MSCRRDAAIFPCSLLLQMFCRKDVCTSETGIPYWCCKICPESDQDLWLVCLVITCIFVCFSLTIAAIVHKWQTRDKGPQRSNINAVNLLTKQTVNFCWIHSSCRRSIWVLLDLMVEECKTYNQQKHKIKRYVSNWVWDKNIFNAICHFFYFFAVSSVNLSILVFCFQIMNLKVLMFLKPEFLICSCDRCSVNLKPLSL